MTAVNIYVTLENIVNSSPAVASTQSFEIYFHSDPTAEGASLTGNEDLSGNPGYVLGKELVFGLESSGVVSQVIASSSKLSLLTSSPTGLCSATETEPLLFAEDMASGCMIEVPSAQFGDCTALRSSVNAVSLLHLTRFIINLY